LIDTDRIYITGASMGGCRTGDLICRYPDKFAAAMPLCGIGDTHQAKKLIHMPIWVFHGDQDARFNVRYSRNMVRAIQKAGWQSILDNFKRYTETVLII
jgi:predicted peptidase